MEIDDIISLFCCLTTRSLDVELDVSTAYCKSSSGDGVDWLWHGIMYHGGLLWLVHFDPAIVSMYHGFPRRSLVFRALLFWCFLIVGIHAFGISAPLSLFMLFGWSLMWSASFIFLVYQWLSRSISFVSFHSGLCPVPLACSETAEFWVRASRISLSCSFILSCMGLPVSPMQTLPHVHGIL